VIFHASLQLIQCALTTRQSVVLTPKTQSRYGEQRTQMNDLKFDDVDAINAAASEEFGPFGATVKITQQMINSFADVTLDHQWIHIDKERAAAGPFGTTIAHGFLTLSLVPHLVHGQLPITGFRNVVNYGADSLRFILPVPADSEVHARSRLVKAISKDTGTLVTSDVAVHIANVETPSILYQMLTLFQG